MENKEEISNIPQKRKHFLPQSSAKDFDKSHTKGYRKLQPKPSIINSKNSISKPYPKNTIQAKENVERSYDNIEKISREKETKLLNLIVKVIIKSTLEQLYGKESY
ncbi:hypothetical protein EA772_02055 [Pedobacter sp. G11]|uniref:hypothetical protein n=1 Tax=Pedobacter sp. G11 TaxID=2482728 RepID=UPI000F5EFD79|nr:hypothetical protein [Pedobacter sp. G11]AZI24187.1 hypothetical protein EA772_02055 [Pedobacter sp. G11]